VSSTIGGAASQAAPLTWLGRFVIEGRLGVGGMGEVFRARDGDRPIALKLMRPEIAADPRHRLMFVTEAQTAARLCHRNLVRLHDFGQTNGLLWMALELIDGLPLDRLLADGPLPPAVAGHAALELLGALAYVHAHMMVHRDVSAANVLVSTAGTIKLSDFGVAKLTTRSMTLTNEQKGKPSYMAPEQLREHALRAPIDGRVDLFAVGVLLHRMTQAEAPFSDVGAWLRAGAPLAATGPLAPVIARAMQPDRRERFADAASMAAAILRALPESSHDAASAMAERVRGCAAVAAPMADFDRLIIAALGGGPGGVRQLDGALDDDELLLETRRGAQSLPPLVPAGDDFSEQIATLMRAPLPPLDNDDDDDGFGEEATTRAMHFEAVRVRPGDSISEAVCTNPVAVDESAQSSLPLAIAALPPVLMPAPPAWRQRWGTWIAGAAGLVAAIVIALVIAHGRHARPAPATAVVAAVAPPVTTTTTRAATTTHTPHRHGSRASKLAWRSAR